MQVEQKGIQPDFQKPSNNTRVCKETLQGVDKSNSCPRIPPLSRLSFFDMAKHYCCKQHHYQTFVGSQGELNHKHI